MKATATYLSLALIGFAGSSVALASAPAQEGDYETRSCAHKWGPFDNGPTTEWEVCDHIVVQKGEVNAYAKGELVNSAPIWEKLPTKIKHGSCGFKCTYTLSVEDVGEGWIDYNYNEIDFDSEATYGIRFLGRPRQPLK